MPRFNIVLAIPSFVLKYGAMLIINTVLRRKRYQKVMSESIKNTWHSRHEIKKKRKELRLRTSKSLGFWGVSRRLSFFLPFDTKRFWKLIVKKDKSSIESYT